MVFEVFSGCKEGFWGETGILGDESSRNFWWGRRALPARLTARHWEASSTRGFSGGVRQRGFPRHFNDIPPSQCQFPCSNILESHENSTSTSTRRREVDFSGDNHFTVGNTSSAIFPRDDTRRASTAADFLERFTKSSVHGHCQQLVQKYNILQYTARGGVPIVNPHTFATLYLANAVPRWQSTTQKPSLSQTSGPRKDLFI